MTEQKREKIECIKSHVKAAVSHVKHPNDVNQAMEQVVRRLAAMGYTKLECEFALKELIQGKS